MFELKDLEPHYGKSIEIDGSVFVLEKVKELNGVNAVWLNDSYLIFATPPFDGVAVPVQVIDYNNQEIGTNGYYPEIDSYGRYCKILKVLAEKILRRARM